MLPGVFITRRMAGTARVIQQWAGDELRQGARVPLAAIVLAAA
jgi:hypothetical protein